MQKKSRYNLIYIFPDQLGYKWLGCAGNPLIKTPNIDQFAKENYNFNSAYSNSPVCTPYRGILFTGKYPSQTKITNNGHELPIGEKLLADYFNEAGYKTAYVGKWHLSGSPHCNRWVPESKRGGFQDFIGWESHHVDHMNGLIWERPDRPVLLEGHETDGLTDIAIQRIDSLQKNCEYDPFCLFISYQAPHPPCTPLSPYQEIYSEVDLCIESNTDREAVFKNHFWGADYDTQEFRQRYYSEISHIDAAFGNILSYVDESGLSENTIVVFTSDHGEMNGCHGLFGKGVMFEESIKIPLMVRFPRQKGREINTPVSTIDLFPSLLDLCNVETNNVFQGRSIKNVMFEDHTSSEDEPVFFEYSDWIGILQNSLKLSINRYNGNLLSCFNLKKDPFEENSLVGSTDLKGQHEILINQLIDWQKGLE